MVLFAPEDTLESLRDYLLRIDPSLAKDLVAPPQKKEGLSLAGAGLGRALMLCPTIQDFTELPQNIEFIVADAPGAPVDYRGFVFLCVRAGMQSDINGEVLLFGKEATQDMLRAKDIARQFNQTLWEREELR